MSDSEDEDMIVYDEDYEEEDEDKDLFDESVKDKENIDKTIKDEEEDNIDEYIENSHLAGEKNKNSSFVSNNPKITVFEISHLISQLAIGIADSKIFIPKEHEELLDVKSGDSIDIAMRWFDNRKKVPLPIQIERNLSRSVSLVKPENLVSNEDLTFGGLDI